MNFLIVTTERKGRPRFGIARATALFSAALQSAGHDVHICSAEDWDGAAEAECARLTTRFARWFRWLGESRAPAFALAERLLQARRLLAAPSRLDGITHIWFQDPVIAFFFIVTTMGRGRHRRPQIIISQHNAAGSASALRLEGYMLPARVLTVWRVAERWTLRHACLVLAPTESALNAVVRDLRYSAVPAHFHALPYGRPAARSVSRIEAKRALAWSDELFHVVVIGRIDPIKNIDVVLRACGLAQERVPNLQLVLVGGILPRFLEDLAACLIRPPICYSTETPELSLAAADVYVSSSSLESYGMANVEALAYELPCIIVAGGAALEVIDYGAWFVAASPQALGQAIVHLAVDEHARSYWAECSSHRYAELPTWADIVQRLIGYLDS